MKLMFFGLGSIGKRHAKVLRDNFDHELFAYRSSKETIGNDFGIEEIFEWEDVKRISPDVAFITNPTFLHIDIAKRCAEMGMNLFIEKPVDSSTEGLDDLLGQVDGNGLVTYVAYNLRFHSVIRYLKEYLSDKKVYHVSVYTSCFLPEHRPAPWRYEKDKGGDVVLDLSHEFDYIKYLFGEITDIDGVFGNVSEATGDSEDFLDAFIKTENTQVNLHLDFISRHVERNIKVDCEGEYIYADLTNGKIEIDKDGDIETVNFDTGTPETYKDQLEYFFDNIKNVKMMNNLQEASGLFKKIVEFKRRTV